MNETVAAAVIVLAATLIAVLLCPPIDAASTLRCAVLLFGLCAVQLAAFMLTPTWQWRSHGEDRQEAQQAPEGQRDPQDRPTELDQEEAVSRSTG
jgi:hypothetical protein